MLMSYSSLTRTHTFILGRSCLALPGQWWWPPSLDTITLHLFNDAPFYSSAYTSPPPLPPSPPPPLSFPPPPSLLLSAADDPFSVDPLYRLEHEQTDKRRAASRKTVLTRLTELADAHGEDDYSSNARLRQEMRARKKKEREREEEATVSQRYGLPGKPAVRGGDGCRRRGRSHQRGGSRLTVSAFPRRQRVEFSSPPYMKQPAQHCFPGSILRGTPRDYGVSLGWRNFVSGLFKEDDFFFFPLPLVLSAYLPPPRRALGKIALGGSRRM